MVVDWTICSLTWKEKDMSMTRMREMIIPAVGIWGEFFAVITAHPILTLVQFSSGQRGGYE
jgi:hypothetical protein